VRHILILAMLGLSSCASLQESETEQVPTRSEQTEAKLDRLAPRDLANGDCGLFVFSVDANPRLILFSDNVGNYGVWASGTGEAPLSITGTSGDPAMGQYPNQSYQAASGQALVLNLEVGGDIEQGVSFPTGTLKITDPEGWERVMPVSAWAACQVSAS